jgi:D-lactate dehydrogenase
VATPVHCVEAGPWELEQLGAAFAAHPELRPWFLPGPAEEHLGELAEARVLSPFIYSNVDAAAFERMPALELVATRSTGYDHVDLDSCVERGITVVNVPTYGENTVAEHTFAMILALSRRLLAAEQRAAPARRTAGRCRASTSRDARSASSAPGESACT